MNNLDVLNAAGTYSDLTWELRKRSKKSCRKKKNKAENEPVESNGI